MSESSKNSVPTPQQRPQTPGGMMGRGGGNMAMMQGGDKAKDFKGTMRSLLGYMRPFWISIVVVVIFAVASTVFSILAPKILGRMTNQVVSDYVDKQVYTEFHAKIPRNVLLPPHITLGQFMASLPPSQRSQIPASNISSVSSLDLTVKPTFHYDTLISIAYELILLYLLSALFSYIQGWIMATVSQKITYNFRRDISLKIGRMPLKYFDSRTYGEVLSRVTNDVDTISQSLNQSMTQIVTSVTMIIGILIMMLSISWLLTLVALVTLPLSFVLIRIIVQHSQKYFKGQQNSLGHINGHVEEMYGGHNIVKVFNGEEKSIAKFNSINQDLYASGWKSQFFSGLMMPLMSVVSNLGYVGVSVFGGWLAINGKVSIGDIQAFIQYVSQFNQPIIQTANSATVLQSTAAAAERVFEFLAEEEETPEVQNPLRLPEIQGKVDFDHVVFGYTPERTIIKGFTASVKAGQRIAIVGPTGAGKTTMVNLLMRFYDIHEGAIKIDGVDICQMKRADVRRMFGMVLQDTWLFNGTIRQNIAYGRAGSSEEEILAASKAAHVDDFVHTLPHGYNMELNEEATNISQGQKQLITIARAMLANSPILILDEATSSVDTRTELLIQKAMERLMKNKTSFVIAHRLSTIRDADLILVMRDGNIVEQGTHPQLLAQNGFYASLYNSQFSDPM